jgi:glycosyltransferase involved in cell wall biosynthesis
VRQTTVEHAYDHVAVIIPAYNPGTVIVDILLGVAKHVPRENILVVDDGSTDHTADRVKQLGISFCRHGHNRGKGAALASGIEMQLTRGAELLLLLDADGQHDPADIPRFLNALTDEYDLLIGDRSGARGEMPLSRRFSNRLSSLIVSWITGRHLPDSQNGFRLIRANVLRQLELVSEHFEFETELLLKAERAGFRTGTLPITGVYFAETSQIRKLRDTFRFISLICRSFFWGKRNVARA